MTSSFDPNALTVHADHIIGGRRVARGGAEIAVRRPSDLTVPATIRDAGDAIVDEAVASARAALAASGWADAAPRDRAAPLFKLAALIEARSEHLARVESLGSTRPIAETAVRDVRRVIDSLRYYAEFADKWEGTITATDSQSLCLVRPEPYGVVGAIVPWNFPMITAAWKFAPALTAGNAVVVKPSELTPLSMTVMAEWAVEAGLPPGLLNVVHGFGHTTGRALVRHPEVGKISFTGSTATGARIVADTAEAGLKPLTLELGGKSPQLVLRDVRDLRKVAANIAVGYLYNAGQVCTAGSRIIAPTEMMDDLVELLVAHHGERKPGATWDAETGLPPIVSEAQARRLEDLLARSRAEGATVVTGGQRLAGFNDGIFFEPTILDGVAEGSTGHREEFFGPVTALYRYDDEEEGIAMAGHPSYGLAASLYTDDAAKALSIPRRIEAGVVWVNAHGRQPEYTAPQGGFKQSGFGKDMGRLGLEGYFRQKTVWYSHG